MTKHELEGLTEEGMVRKIMQNNGTATVYEIEQTMLSAGVDEYAVRDHDDELERFIRRSLEQPDAGGVAFAVQVTPGDLDSDPVWKVSNTITKTDWQYVMAAKTAQYAFNYAGIEAMREACMKKFGKAPDNHLPHPDTLDLTIPPRHAQ